jgi:hypothetical protein
MRWKWSCWALGLWTSGLLAGLGLGLSLRTKQASWPELLHPAQHLDRDQKGYRTNFCLARVANDARELLFGTRILLCERLEFPERVFDAVRRT